MNRRAVVVLLGVIVVLLALNLAALGAKDEPKPMIAVPKRCVGITSQVVPGHGLYLVRAFEDGTTEVLLAGNPIDLRSDRWRAVPEPAGATARGEAPSR